MPLLETLVSTSRVSTRATDHLRSFDHNCLRWLKIAYDGLERCAGRPAGDRRCKRILHPYPDKRFAVMHPRQEPCAGCAADAHGRGFAMNN
jgi:hypothetical protein